MKAAYLIAPGKIEINEVPPPQLGGEDVLITPICLGICGTDVSFFMGHRMPPSYPLLIGHEVVGRVAAIGADVTRIAVGQRVVVEPNYPCGICTFCRAGRGNICPNKKSPGVTIPGCFADQFTAPVEFVWPVADTISDENAVTIEPLAVSLHALWQSGAQIGDTVAVLGCGSTGLLLIQAAISQGIRVFAHDKLESKLDIARELGAQVNQSPDISELWRHEGVTSVFECAGATANGRTGVECRTSRRPGDPAWSFVPPGQFYTIEVRSRRTSKSVARSSMIIQVIFREPSPWLKAKCYRRAVSSRRLFHSMKLTMLYKWPAQVNLLKCY